MSYKNDERLITILRLVQEARLGSDRTGLFEKREHLVDEMGETIVGEILPVLLEKNYIRIANDKFEKVQGYPLEYDAYQITAMGKNYLTSLGSVSQSVNIGNISSSNIAINSKYVSQIIDKQDDETKELLKQLLDATEKKDKSKILKILGYIGDKSLSLLIAIIAGGVKS